MTARLLARSSDDLSFACVNPWRLASFVCLACLLAAKEFNRHAQGKCAELQLTRYV